MRKGCGEMGGEFIGGRKEGKIDGEEIVSDGEMG